MVERIEAYVLWLWRQLAAVKCGKDWQTAARIEVRIAKLQAIAALCDEEVSIALLDIAASALQDDEEAAVAAPPPRGQARDLTIRQRRFLAAYAATGEATSAAKTAKVGRRTHNDWLKSHPAYLDAFNELRFGALQPIRVVQG